MMDDFDQGEDRITRVDRRQAAEIAVLLESVLPRETELRQLMEEGSDQRPV